MNEAWVALVGVLAASLVLEAVVVLVVTTFVPLARVWRSPKNLALAVADLACGAGLGWWIVGYSDGPMAGWPLAVIFSVAVLHGFRVWERAAGREGAFAAHTALVVFDGVKLALALGALVWVAVRIL